MVYSCIYVFCVCVCVRLVYVVTTQFPYQKIRMYICIYFDRYLWLSTFKGTINLIGLVRVGDGKGGWTKCVNVCVIPSHVYMCAQRIMYTYLYMKDKRWIMAVICWVKCQIVFCVFVRFLFSHQLIVPTVCKSDQRQIYVLLMAVYLSRTNQ